MKRMRATFGLVLSFALAACSALPSSIGPTATSIVTATSETSIPVATASFTPAPPISALTRIQSGEQALFNGDYEQARTEFASAFRDGSSPQIQVAALWGQARTEFADGRYDAALIPLQKINIEYPDSAFIPYANFLMGKANYELGRFQEAAANYSIYLELRPGVLDAYVQELRGDALYDNGDFPPALEAYNAAVVAPQIGDTLTAEIKIAQTRTEIGDYASAISTYDAIFNRTGNDYVKAQMDYLIGLAHQEVEQGDLANERFMHAVLNYPLSYYSYLGLIELVNAGVPVNDLDRGLVDYFSGQYDVALAALERHIKAGLDTDGTARYYRALTHQELQNYEIAIQGFSDFIANYPNHARWAEAWSDKAYTQWFYVGDYQKGAKTYLDFVDAAPTQPEAVDYLMIAARLLERNNRLEEASQVWQRVANEYPDSPQTSLALFLAGIVQYRRGDYHIALPIFNRSLILSTQIAWQQAESSDPSGYYSERARELIIGRAPFEPPTSYNIDIDLESERQDAASWVRLTFDLPPETDLDGLGPLAGDIRIVRGTEFWELGLYSEARQEFENLREFVNTSPENSFRLANYLLKIGLYRPGIFAARQVLTLAGLDEHASSLTAPAYFNHVRYGTYYADLILPNAEAQSLHPLFLFSVMRQESLFEGFIRSNAGARGLMQIIPSTGASIAKSIGWPVAFEIEDLYRPNVSVRLGAQYMAANQKHLDGDLYAALAAYNAGPGNAAVWKDLAGDDQDLFLETVRFQETRNYIRYIYEIFEIYRTLYSPVN